MVDWINILYNFKLTGEALGAIGCIDAVPILEKYKDDSVIEVLFDHNFSK